MKKIGPKEQAIRALRDADTDIPTFLRRGHPDCSFQTRPAPRKALKGGDAGVTLAPPPAIQRAIAADLAGPEDQTKPAAPVIQPTAIKETPMATKKAQKKTATAKRKAQPAKPAASAKAKAPRKGAYDWPAAEAQAAKGIIPPQPPLAESTGHLGQLKKVAELAKAKDTKGLGEFKKLAPTTYGRKVVGKYAAVCISALEAHG